jgi:CheY-like chemotaxis protein
MPHGCCVLVVDDDADLREVLRVALVADGYSVSTVANGREALDHLRSTADTCIIVLNLMMPVMDGIQFREGQLRDRALAWIPIVIVSGAVDGAPKARELGATMFVRKPIDLDEVRRALRQIGCARLKSQAPKREQRAARAPS